MFTFLLCVFVSNPVFFADAGAEQPAEQLPAPNRAADVEIGVVPPEMPAFAGYYRTSRYEVWQNYAVNRQGHFRARVIYAPSGAYYLYNHQPYLYVPTRNRDFESSVVAPPAPSYPVPNSRPAWE